MSVAFKTPDVLTKDMIVASYQDLRGPSVHSAPATTSQTRALPGVTRWAETHPPAGVTTSQEPSLARPSPPGWQTIISPPHGSDVGSAAARELRARAALDALLLRRGGSTPARLSQEWMISGALIAGRWLHGGLLTAPEPPVSVELPQREVTAAERSLERFGRWLEQLTDEQATMPAALVRRLWTSLLLHAGVPLQAPTAGPGGELAFYFAWRREGVYLDIDIAPDGRFEWFWTDRGAGEAEGSEDERLKTPPEALIRRLVKDFHLR